jgi:acylphosphatase
VEAVFEGSPEAVEQMIAWCRVGPPRARVDDVEVRVEPVRNEISFVVV